MNCTHELNHVTKKHILDVLLIELLKSCTMNPILLISIKKAIQLNQ
jgi:beta-lactamase regulating signal transducer with metallopeptidase domain